MKKYYVFFILIIANLTYAQEIEEVEVMRYYYESKVFVDKSENIVREGTAIVDVRDGQSRFMDYASYEKARWQLTKADNTSKEEIMQKVISYRPVFSWFVITDKNINRFYNKIGRLMNFYQEDRAEIKWNIKADKLKWNNYTVQEATATYGGREWTVWFTQDILGQVGPYKFNNLPGFVVKAWDAEEQYSFEFLNSQKVNVIWDINEVDAYTESSKEKTKKAMSIDANKTFLSDLEGTGITIGGAGKELLNRKKGNHQNPIERDF